MKIHIAAGKSVRVTTLAKSTIIESFSKAMGKKKRISEWDGKLRDSKEKEQRKR